MQAMGHLQAGGTKASGQKVRVSGRHDYREGNKMTSTAMPDHRVDGYNSQAAPVRPPQAAMFDKGATTLPEIEDACDQRREHSRLLSKPAPKRVEGLPA